MIDAGCELYLVGTDYLAREIELKLNDCSVVSAEGKTKHEILAEIAAASPSRIIGVGIPPWLLLRVYWAFKAVCGVFCVAPSVPIPRLGFMCRPFAA